MMGREKRKTSGADEQECAKGTSGSSGPHLPGLKWPRRASCGRGSTSSCLPRSSSHNHRPPHSHRSTLRAYSSNFSRSEEGEEEEEEVPEQSECRFSSVCFSLKLLLQDGLLLHRLLCRSAGLRVIGGGAWLLHVYAEGGHGADRLRLVLL